MIPYEIHLTVPLDPNRTDELEWFKQVCASFNAKAIVIDADPLVDVMSSYRMMSENQNEAVKEMTKQITILQGIGFCVIRSKLETSLQHPAALTPLPDQYFESHIQVLCTDEQVGILRDLSKELQFHVSRNAFKTMQNGKHVRMATLREHNSTPTVFRNLTKSVRNVLEINGFDFHKEMEVEFALYDSNQSHDLAWLQKNQY
jgi:hypothetical protein